MKLTDAEREEVKAALLEGLQDARGEVRIRAALALRMMDEDTPAAPAVVDDDEHARVIMERLDRIRAEMEEEEREAAARPVVVLDKTSEADHVDTLPIASDPPPPPGPSARDLQIRRYVEGRPPEVLVETPTGPVQVEPWMVGPRGGFVR